ncbi:eukaryotic translation initiation factor 4E1 [Drosophila grimshawi]|uniref:eIF-4F 25 kDa subunit n=1 Tax=Drosophila grimshawi TaxID=7222 RepID=B4J093_DROGR|nr:eukaryotic translation initiation factor 4E1 [Drosophila grimshawi]EDV95694.1 GH15637 [Drosophila grimshawi]
MLLAKQNSFNILDSDTELPAVDSKSTTSQDLKPNSDDEMPSKSNSKQELIPIRYKHPLEHTWTLWYLENDRNKSWEEMQNEITSFDMVEDFWSLYNHIKPPSELKIGSDYSLFKKGIQPMWEDDTNKNGGRWVISIGRCSHMELDKLWLDVLLILIGEAVHYTDEICGAVINLRSKTNKISIWTANGQNELALMEIGHKLLILLGLPPNNLQYQLHKDSMCKQASLVKAAYIL